MNIVACIKRVPDTETQAKVAPDGKGLDATGVQFMCSFYDEIAVEEAVKTKENVGGEVTVVTLGPAEVKKEILDALAKGADKAVLLKDDAWAQRDCRATAKILAAKIQELGADVVFCGRVATDRDNGAVGPMLATLLGWQCVTDVIELELGADGKGTAKRESEAGIETFTFSLPAVLTCQKDLNEPRFSNLKGIMAAKKKPLEEAAFEDVASQAEVTGVELPPTRPPGRIIGEGAEAVPALLEALRNEAKVL
jgi:electron transfer flavoprotein beta subunit